MAPIQLKILSNTLTWGAWAPIALASRASLISITLFQHATWLYTRSTWSAWSEECWGWWSDSSTGSLTAGSRTTSLPGASSGSCLLSSWWSASMWADAGGSEKRSGSSWSNRKNMNKCAERAIRNSQNMSMNSKFDHQLSRFKYSLGKESDEYGKNGVTDLGDRIDT